MQFDQFIDRGDYLERLRVALDRPAPQFIVIYGRRRIGKSALIKETLRQREGGIYFLSDQTSEANQRLLFARSAAAVVEGFDKIPCSDWETLLRTLNRFLDRRTAVCLDEFPYLVRSCPALPSILQKLLNERCLKFDLILCGSSQQLMQGYVLDRKEPLYGLADEILRLTPIPPHFICEALGCNPAEAVAEYAVWGGIPRYWELRADYPDLDTAIRRLLLDPKGFLSDEPLRLLRDDMRDTVQASTLLSVIGNGVCRLSEMAARLERNSTQLTEPLTRLRELGYVRREVPFGEDARKSRRGLYRIDDPLLAFNYRFVTPNRSFLELDRADMVFDQVRKQWPAFVGECWEHLCRRFVSGREVDGVIYGLASRWWGKVFADGDREGRMVELDVVVESLDRKHLLVGECKWTAGEDAARLHAELAAKARALPFVRQGQQVHLALFLKTPPVHPEAARCFLPADVIA